MFKMFIILLRSSFWETAVQSNCGRSRPHSLKQIKPTSPRAEFHNPQGTMGNHTGFLVDLGETDSRLAPCCGLAACHRGRRQRLRQVELEERSRTKAELARLDEEAQPCSQGPASHLHNPTYEQCPSPMIARANGQPFLGSALDRGERPAVRSTPLL